MNEIFEHHIKSLIINLLNKFIIKVYKRPVYIFAFGEYNYKQVNVSC